MLTKLEMTRDQILKLVFRGAGRPGRPLLWYPTWYLLHQQLWEEAEWQIQGQLWNRIYRSLQQEFA